MAFLKHYDPNISWAKHTFEITYMQWDYKLKTTVEVGGNCKGFDLFDSAISAHADKLFKDQGDFPALILFKNNNEDTLETSFADEDGGDLEDWLKSMCISIQIVKHVKEDRK